MQTASRSACCRTARTAVCSRWSDPQDLTSPCRRSTSSASIAGDANSITSTSASIATTRTGSGSAPSSRSWLMTSANSVMPTAATGAGIDATLPTALAASHPRTATSMSWRRRTKPTCWDCSHQVQTGSPSSASCSAWTSRWVCDRNQSTGSLRASLGGRRPRDRGRGCRIRMPENVSQKSPGMSHRRARECPAERKVMG